MRAVEPVHKTSEVVDKAWVEGDMCGQETKCDGTSLCSRGVGNVAAYKAKGFTNPSEVLGGGEARFWGNEEVVLGKESGDCVCNMLGDGP
jgi:hypothetical protein